MAHEAEGVYVNTITYAALAFGVSCLLVGYISNRPTTKLSHNNIVMNWFLMGLGAGSATFALFPESSATGGVLGFKLGGASALLFAVWIYGMRKAREAVKLDGLEEQIRQRDAEIQRLKEEIKHLEEEARPPETLKVCEKHMYTVKNGKKIGLITGDIKNVRGIDVWVNSENTDMEMARYSDRSVSASIRYYGADRDEAGDVNKGGDLIADELKRKKGDKLRVEPTIVYVTGPGKLTSNGVKQIFHVAAVQGPKASGYHPVGDLESCVTKPLDLAEALRDQGYRSILFPLMTTGTAKGDLKPTSTRLIRAAVSYLEDNPDHAIDTVYFLAYTNVDRKTCTDIFKDEIGDRATCTPTP